MSQLPILEKNAYLTIQLTHNSICANLSYSHYDIGRHYVIHDEAYFDPENDEATEQVFWDEYFSELSKSLDWEITISTETKISMAEIVKFKEEGFGVAGISFVAHNSLPNRVKIMSVLHSYLPTADLFVQTDKEFEKFLPELTAKLGYKNLLYVNADLEKFDVIGLNVVDDRGKKDGKLVKTKIYWDSKEALIKAIQDKKIKAFSSIDMESDENMNLWANFVSRPVSSSDNYDLHDILRSFFTVQLSTILSNKPAITYNSIESSRSRLVVVEGILARLLDDKEIVISLLDGLQMSGDFDLLIDHNSQFTPYGRKFTDGINAKDYIVPISTVMDNLQYVSVLEVPGKRSGKAIFSGEFIRHDKKRKDVYVLSSEFREFEFGGDKESRVVFSGKPVGGAKIKGNGSDEIVLVSDHEDKLYRSVFLDGRFKPVVYGPDYRRNKDKLKVWTNE